MYVYNFCNIDSILEDVLSFYISANFFCRSFKPWYNPTYYDTLEVKQLHMDPKGSVLANPFQVRSVIFFRFGKQKPEFS